MYTHTQKTQIQKLQVNLLSMLSKYCHKIPQKNDYHDCRTSLLRLARYMLAGNLIYTNNCATFQVQRVKASLHKGQWEENWA